MTTPGQGSVADAPAWRRLVSYLLDYLVIVAYFGIMSLVYLLLQAFGASSKPSYITLTDKLVGQTVSILLFTLPVVCYFALLEASIGQATLGKHLMRERVVGLNGERISHATSFVRSVIKFTPWEIAHTGIWHVSGQPFLSPPGVLSICAWCASSLLALCWVVSLFTGDGRTPYDRIANTRVVLRTQTEN